MVGRFRSGGLFPRLVTVDPFPLLMNLPSRQNGMALLLYVQRGCSTLALLDNGVIRRIRTIPLAGPPKRTPPTSMFPYPNGKTPLCPDSPTAAARNVPRIGRDAFRTGSPSRLWRGLSRNGASARFAEAFELPVSVLGQEVPLAGQVARLGETDPSRLLALCVAAMPLPAPWRPPLFPSFHRPPKEAIFPANTAGVWHGPPAARLPWRGLPRLRLAEGYAAGQQAVRHEDAARSLFRKALPDVRGSFNPVQMRASSKTALPDCARRGERRHIPGPPPAAGHARRRAGLPRHPPRPPEPRRPPLRAQRTAASYEQSTPCAWPCPDSPRPRGQNPQCSQPYRQARTGHAVGRGHL